MKKSNGQGVTTILIHIVSEAEEMELKWKYCARNNNQAKAGREREKKNDWGNTQGVGGHRTRER